MMNSTAPHGRRLFLHLMVLSLLLAIAPAGKAEAQASERCFPETDFCITGRIREFWEQNGGLPVFGYPTTLQREELIEGKPFQVQWFERNRLELHPENARPYDVLLGRLGVDRLAQQGRDWFTFPKGSEQSGCRLFAETGHAVCGDFLAYFRSQGLDLGQPGVSEAESRALFGLPLSEATDEVSLTNGRTYRTQWFERARLEFHPENQPPFTVLLGLLGNEVHTVSQQPRPQPSGPCDNIPPSTNVAVIPGTCVDLQTDMIIGAYGFAPSEKTIATITAPTGASEQFTSDIPTSSHGKLIQPFSTEGLIPGIWTIVFQGVSSQHQATIAIRILAPDQQPSNRSLILVLPPRGPATTRFDFAATGFKPGERVGFYITMPDKSVFGASFQDTATDLGYVIGNSFTAPPFSPTGTWAVTFEGVESHHTVIGTFEITP